MKQKLKIGQIIFYQNAKNISLKNIIKKYPDYDLFLYCFVYERNVYFKDYNYRISIQNVDNSDSIYFFTNNLFSNIRFFYKHYTLDYALTKFEASIIKREMKLFLNIQKIENIIMIKQITII